MKYAISLLITFNVYASPINVYYEGKSADASVYKELLVTEYQIPEELISVSGTKECEAIKGGGKLDICLKNNGDLLMVSVDSEFINESLKVFRAP
jgi:hypothetical protein